MQLDAIQFFNGETIFRPTGSHTYSTDCTGVVDIVSVRLKRPQCFHALSPPLIKNICGRFTTYLDEYTCHFPVSKRPRTSLFGRQKIMHHLHGTVNVHCGVAYFKGCCGHRSLVELSKDLFMETPRCEVHMGVFKAFLGRHLQTSHGCYLESRVAHRFKCVRVCTRLFENCQAVKLRVERFDEAELPHLTGPLVPTSLDLTITNTGVLLMRFSWARCAWSPESEHVVLRFCSWMAEQLRECC